MQSVIMLSVRAPNNVLKMFYNVVTCLPLSQCCHLFAAVPMDIVIKLFFFITYKRVK